MGTLRFTVHFIGRVQGVGFRYTARTIAARYPVSGYVQNLPDGRVKLVAEGEAADLDALLAELSGDMADYIREKTVEKSPATGELGRPGVDPLTIRH